MLNISIVRKKKTCAGFDGNPHEDYIYKNIDGKKYCKICAFKIQPQKTKFKIKIKQSQYQADSLFYRRVWNKEFYAKLSTGEVFMIQSPRCSNCKKRLGEEPNMMFFHHILEKRKYPQYRHDENNIVILCPNCHGGYETFPDKFPLIQKRKEELIKLYNL